MKHKPQSATTFLRRKYPVLKAVMDYGFGLLSKEIRFIVLMMFTGSLFTFNSCRHNQLAAKVENNATAITNTAAAVVGIENYIAP